TSKWVGLPRFWPPRFTQSATHSISCSAFTLGCPAWPTAAHWRITARATGNSLFFMKNRSCPHHSSRRRKKHWQTLPKVQECPSGPASKYGMERINPASWHADWRFALRAAGEWQNNPPRCRRLGQRPVERVLLKGAHQQLMRPRQRFRPEPRRKHRPPILRPWNSHCLAVAALPCSTRRWRRDDPRFAAAKEKERRH